MNQMVLVVDDNRINRLVLTTLLKRIGLENIEEAENGLDAVDAFKKVCHDLIFMDFQMPEMDGIECTKAIVSYAESAGHTKPIIFGFTSGIDSQYMVDAKKAGMSDFIQKPMLIEDISRKVHRIQSH